MDRRRRRGHRRRRHRWRGDARHRGVHLRHAVPVRDRRGAHAAAEPVRQPPTTTWPRPLMRPERGPTSCTARRRHCAARACATPLTARRPWRLPGTVAGRLSRVAGLRRRSPALRTGSDTIQASWARAAELVTSRRYRDQAGRPRPQCPLGWPQCGPSSRYPAMAGLSTTLVQPSSRLSKCSYASGARRSGRRWETIHDGLARPAWMRSRSRRL
jgi:hypothetical protein